MRREPIAERVEAAHRLIGRNNVISRNGGASDPGAGQTGQAAPGAPEIDIHHRDGLVNALEQVLDPVVELLAIRRSGTRSAAVVQFVGQGQERPPVGSEIGRGDEDRGMRGQWRRVWRG